MFKPLLFAVLYIVLGVVGWRAYTTIDNTNVSVSTVKPSSPKTTPTEIQQPETLSKTVHRWKDRHGNWQYGELPTNGSKMEKYEKELALLRKLPREALPTQAITPEKKNDSSLDNLPSWPDITRRIKTEQTETPLIQRMSNALNGQDIEQILKQREKQLRDIESDF